MCVCKNHFAYTSYQPALATADPCYQLPILIVRAVHHLGSTFGFEIRKQKRKLSSSYKKGSQGRDLNCGDTLRNIYSFSWQAWDCYRAAASGEASPSALVEALRETSTWTGEGS